MSSSNTLNLTLQKLPVSSYHYKQTLLPVEIEDEPQEVKEPEVLMTEKELADRLAAERAAGFAEAELKLRKEFDEKVAGQTVRITRAIADFEQVQRDYFLRVEGEVVRLALSIAGKILHREAQVDPLLIAALVHLAIGQLKDGSAASIRVRPEQSRRWREHLASLTLNISVKVIEDPELLHGDCILETELGMANFGLDAQLKEVERGFFDVLAQKPQI